MSSTESRSDSAKHIPSTERTRARRSTDITEAASNAFDVHRVYNTFVSALRESDNPKSPIGTQDYIDGYRELLK